MTKGEYDNNEGRQKPGKYSMVKMSGSNSLNEEHAQEQYKWNGFEQIVGYVYVGCVCVNKRSK